MNYICDKCKAIFKMFPGEGYIGPSDWESKHCSPHTEFTVRCKNCMPCKQEIKPEKITNYRENHELLDIVLEIPYKAEVAILNTFDSGEKDEYTLYLNAIADALKYEDPIALGKAIYPKAREALMDIIDDMKSTGELDHPHMRYEDE